MFLVLHSACLSHVLQLLRLLLRRWHNNKPHITINRSCIVHDLFYLQPTLQHPRKRQNRFKGNLHIESLSQILERRLQAYFPHVLTPYFRNKGFILLFVHPAEINALRGPTSAFTEEQARFTKLFLYYYHTRLQRLLRHIKKLSQRNL